MPHCSFRQSPNSWVAQLTHGAIAQWPNSLIVQRQSRSIVHSFIYSMALLMGRPIDQSPNSPIVYSLSWLIAQSLSRWIAQSLDIQLLNFSIDYLPDRSRAHAIASSMEIMDRKATTKKQCHGWTLKIYFQTLHSTPNAWNFRVCFQSSPLIADIIPSCLLLSSRASVDDSAWKLYCGWKAFAMVWPQRTSKLDRPCCNDLAKLALRGISAPVGMGAVDWCQTTAPWRKELPGCKSEMPRLSFGNRMPMADRMQSIRSGFQKQKKYLGIPKRKRFQAMRHICDWRSFAVIRSPSSERPASGQSCQRTFNKSWERGRSYSQPPGRSWERLERNFKEINTHQRMPKRLVRFPCSFHLFRRHGVVSG
jgi:hypothetical protein